MATDITPCEDRLAQVSAIKVRLQECNRALGVLKQMEVTRLESYKLVVPPTYLQDRLKDIGDAVAKVATDLDAISWVYADRFKACKGASNTTGFDYYNVDVDTGATKASLQGHISGATSACWGALVTAGDRIKVEWSNDADNNRVFVVDTAATFGVLFTEKFAGSDFTSRNMVLTIVQQA